jgi:hypothetical protein
LIVQKSAKVVLGLQELPLQLVHAQKRFWRLSQRGFFEAFFEALADNSETVHLVVMLDSTVVRAHVSAAGAKGGKKLRRLDDPARSQLRAGRENPSPAFLFYRAPDVPKGEKNNCDCNYSRRQF